jgi:branched-chain amino acid transport system permease protein
MTDLVQTLIDGLGRGSIYALLALGIALIFGVMHLLNFAHGETITVGAYIAVASLVGVGSSWWVTAILIFFGAIAISVVIEFVAFRWVRGADDFTMLLTSFGVHIVVQALFLMFAGATVRSFPRPDWADRVWQVGDLNVSVIDVATIGATAVALALTAYVLRRTMFGTSLRAAAEDFDAARLMGLRSNRVIRRAFIVAGALAGVAAVFYLMRTGQARPVAGLAPMLKGILAAIVGGLGSLPGAVLGGFALGVTEVVLRAWLPQSLVGLTDALVFACIGLLFVFRPQGLISVETVERV